MGDRICIALGVTRLGMTRLGVASGSGFFSGVLAFSPLSKEEIFPFIKITHNSRYSFKYTWFFIEFIRCLFKTIVGF